MISNPSIGTRTLTGSYVGDNVDTGRQIVTGFKCTFVAIISLTYNDTRWIVIPSASIMDATADDNLDGTTAVHLHATDGFVVGDSVVTGNRVGNTYYWMAVSE